METNLELRTKADKYFEQACKELGITNALPDVSMLPERNQKAILAYYKLSVIIQCVNEGWEPNWQHWDERKYYPWFGVLHADLGYSNTYIADSRAFASIGSRLCYKSPDLARELGREASTSLQGFLADTKIRRGSNYE